MPTEARPSRRADPRSHRDGARARRRRFLVDEMLLMGLPIRQVRTPAELWTMSGWEPDRELPRRPIMLDTFCGRGGAAVGYYAAGFDIVGVDIEPQPRYPFPFVQGDAIAFIREHGHLFDAIHASVPCQGYSHLKMLTTRPYPLLIARAREACRATGRLYVIENVEGARGELLDPITLCMGDWARRLYRHRLFESNVRLLAPMHLPHDLPQAKLGRPAGPDEAYVAVGNFPQVAEVRRQMEMPWSDRRGIAEAVPPVMTDYVGRQIYARLIDAEAAEGPVALPV